MKAAMAKKRKKKSYVLTAVATVKLEAHVVAISLAAARRVATRRLDALWTEEGDIGVSVVNSRRPWEIESIIT